MATAAVGAVLAITGSSPVSAQSLTPEREAAARRHMEIGLAARQGVVLVEWLADGSRFRFRVPSDDPPAWRVYDPANRRISPDTGGQVADAPPSTQSEEFREVGRGDFGYPMMERPSPDGRWLAHRRDHDLWLRRAGTEEFVRLTDDGTAGAYWGESFEWDGMGGRPWAWWSPDGSQLAVKRRDVSRVPTVTRLRFRDSQALAETEPFSVAGDPMPTRELFLFNVSDGTRMRVEDGDEGERWVQALGWSDDGSEFRYLTLDRSHRMLRLLAADAATGVARVLLEERRETYHSPLWAVPPTFAPLSGDGSFLWVSDRDGYRHLYRMGMDGQVEAQLTRGPFSIQDVLRVDEAGGWIHVTGRPDPARPYDLHLLRVRLDGSGMEQLTDGVGWHDVRLSPSGEVFVDTYSSPTTLPVTVVRRSDGTVLDTLAQAHLADLEDALGTRWVPPEEVVVLASDGVTELHGVLYRPFDFDPSRLYPVLEYIYDASNTTVVPRAFSGVSSGDPGDGYPFDSLDPLALAQLGYLVWVMDGRGGASRGRAFRDAPILGGFDFVEEHVGALRQVAKSRPYVDLDRVGIWGISAGGNQTVNAMLRAPAVYRVGVAIAAPTDPRLLTASLEYVRGPPDENPDAYEPRTLNSVSRLQGKLLIVHGTDDRVVPLIAPLRLIEALVAAGRPYDLLLLPGEGHITGPASAWYAREAVWRYFLEHLSPGN